MTGSAMQTTKKLITGIEAAGGLKIFGKPAMSVFGFGSADPAVEVFAVGDIMEHQGWHVDRIQRPDGLHAMVTPAHERVADEYLSDLRSALERVRSDPGLSSRGNAALYGMMAHIPFRRMIKKEVGKMMENLYGPKGQQPMDNFETPPFWVRMGMGVLGRISRWTQGLGRR